MDREKVKQRLIFWYSILWILLIIALYLGYGVYFVDTISTKSKWIILFSSAVSLLLAACKFLEVSFYKYNDEKLADKIKEQNRANSIFYRYKNGVLFLFLAVFFIIFHKFINTDCAICATVGVIIFSIASKLSSIVSLRGAIRAKDALLSSFNTSLKINFNSSVSVSFLYWALLCSSSVILYHIFKDYEVLIGFVFGVSLGAFFENLICAISRKSLKNTDEFIQKYEHSNDRSNPVLTLKNVVNNYNCSTFFEAFIIALSASVVMGANSIGLMGSFLPLVVTANSMFISIIVVLFSKINKTNNISKLFLKNAIIIVLLSSILTYFELHYWLGKDFTCLSYSVLLGGILGILSLFYNKDKNTVNEFQQIKKSALKVIFAISAIVITFSASFLLNDGIEAVIFALFGITLLALGYNLIIIIASCANQDVQLQKNASNYSNISTVLLVFSTIIAFIMVKELNEADILNPIVMMSLFLGLLVPYITNYICSNAILKQAKDLILSSKKQIKNKEIKPDIIVLKSVRYSSSAAIFLILGGCIILYLISKFLGFEALVAFILGNAIASCFLLFNKTTLSKINASFVRFFAIALLGLIVLFI
ncbi:sodium/proton-translocating pyrophosphatase [bacterium]|nr:sodium/proton-translocating pyrophosphatase [bacterium]